MSRQRTSTTDVVPVNIASIDDLPSEVLCKILLAAIRLPTVHPGQHLSVFSEVNHYWRNLCLNSSELWTDIWIPFEWKQGVKLLEWTETWLKRSQPRLINAFLDTSTDESGTRLDDVEGLLRLLTQQLPRMKSLKFVGKLQSHGSFLLNSTGLVLSLRTALHLEHLQLILTDELFSVFTGDWESTTPNLRSLKIVGLAIPPFAPTRLTSLDVHHLVIYEEAFRDFVLKSPFLERLTLRRPFLSAVSTDAPPIDIPSLRYLSVGFHENLNQRSVLSLLSVPNLEYLQIMNSHVLPPFHLCLPNPAHLSKLHTLQLYKIHFDMPSTGEQRMDPSYFFQLPCVQHLQLISTPGDKLFPEIERKPKPIRRSRSIDRRDAFSSLALGDRPTPFRHRELALRAFEIPYEVTLPSANFSVGIDTSGASDINITSHTPSSTSLLSSHIHSSSSSTNVTTTFPHLTTFTLDSIRAQDILWLCELIGHRTAIQRVYLSKAAMRHLISSFMIESVDGNGSLLTTGDVGGSDGGKRRNRNPSDITTSPFTSRKNQNLWSNAKFHGERGRPRSQRNFDNGMVDPATSSSNLSTQGVDSSGFGPSWLNRTRNELNGDGISEEAASESLGPASASVSVSNSGPDLRVTMKGSTVARMLRGKDDTGTSALSEMDTGKLRARIRTRRDSQQDESLIDNTEAERSGAPQGGAGGDEKRPRLTLEEWLRSRVELCEMDWDNEEFCASL